MLAINQNMGGSLVDKSSNSNKWIIFDLIPY